MDSKSCGSTENPCKTIAMGVWQATQHANIYIDGTGTATTPYDCISSRLKYPGIYSNKSVAIIGVQSMANVRCQEGYHIQFNTSVFDSNATSFVSLSNMKFVNTSIQAHDVSLDINDCVFSDGMQAVKTVQSTKPISIAFTKSLCVNTSSCIAVSITQRILPTNRLYISLTNSNIHKSTRTYQPTTHDTASGIDVTSSNGEYEPGFIACNITLKNVTFKENFIGVRGLIFINLTNALTSMDCKDVLFQDSKTKTKMSKYLITFLDSYTHDMTLNHIIFTQNSRHLYGAIQVKVKNLNKLEIINSRFERFVAGRHIIEGVLSLSSDNGTFIHIQDTIFQNNTDTGNTVGGCLSLHSQTATVELKDSYFSNNQASCAGIMWLFAQDRANVTIKGCSFVSNYVSGPGGVASFKGDSVLLTMTDSTVITNTADGPGGLFDIGLTGCGKTVPINNVTVVLDHVTLKGITSPGPGGLMTLDATTASIRIQDSMIGDVLAQAGQGGILYAASIDRPPNTLGRSLKLDLENTTIDSVHASMPGGVMYIESVTDVLVTFNNSHVKNCSIFSGPGGVVYSAKKVAIQIRNSIFESNTANGPGGVIYSDGPLALEIDDSVFKYNSAQGPGGAISADDISHLQITNSVFECNTAVTPGGSLYLVMLNTDVILRNVTFQNSSSMNGPGGAIYFSHVGGKVRLEQCKFFNNMSPGVVGGAIAFDFSNSDQILDPGCIKDQTINGNHRKWSYNTSVVIRDCVFVNNTALNGGALAFSNGNHTIKGCLFVDNFAKFQGGHIYMYSDSTSLQILDSKLNQQSSEKIVNYLSRHFIYGLCTGVFIDSQSVGPLIIHNSTLESTSPWLQGIKTLVTVSKGNYVDFGENNQTVLMCPRGHDMDILNFTTVINTEYESHNCKIALTVLQVICTSCGIGSYSLQHGQSLGMRVVSGFQCLPCPFGAECANSIKAKPNFWGYKVKEIPLELNFTLCPTGYCKQPSKTFGDYNSCHGNRTGTLCGTCKKNYSETLLSPSCRHNDECTDTWSWGLSVVMVLLMALYLIHKPDLLRMLRRQIVWFSWNDFKENHEDQRHDHSNGGYLKIVFYFYQVAKILLVTTSYNTIVEAYILQPVVGIFIFEFRLSSSGILCPFPGLTAVTKQLLFVSQVFGVLFMIAVSYCCHRLLRKCRSKSPPNMGPYLGAVLETLLLGYAVFVYNALQLLRCTSLDGESRLFISGDVKCYQWWQYVLMVFVGVAVFPFILTLALGSRWLYKDTITIKEFLLGCVFPLPFLVYKVLYYFLGTHEQRQVFPREEPRDDPRSVPREGPHHEPTEWKVSVSNVLYGPFRDDVSCGVYWESVLVLRRLIIIIIFVSVRDPLSKELLLTLTCVGVLFHHTIVRPFRHQAANVAEMTSLFSLIVIAAINTFKASFLSIGQVPDGPLRSIAEIVDWAQIVILLLVPVLCILAVMVAIVSQVIRGTVALFTCSWRLCCGDRSREEFRNLLEPSTFETDSS